jgi:hypothetical protein
VETTDVSLKKVLTSIRSVEEWKSLVRRLPPIRVGTAEEEEKMMALRWGCSG